MVEKVIKIEMIFDNSGGWESDGPRRVASAGGADSMLQYRLQVAAVQIQCFNFDFRGEATGRSITRR
jgi:hypothetical protein